MTIAAFRNMSIHSQPKETNGILNSIGLDAPTNGANALFPGETIVHESKKSQKPGNGNCICDPLAYVESSDQNVKAEPNLNETLATGDRNKGRLAFDVFSFVRAV